MEPAPKIDLTVKLDFCNERYGIGEHTLCFWGCLSPKHRLDARRAESKGIDVVAKFVEEVRKGGWDLQRLPYDRETNPFMDKLKLIIYRDENNCITKTRPTNG